jgi:transposase
MVPTMDERKRGKKPRRSFTDEFKAGVVRLVLDEGKSRSQVARDMGLSLTSVGVWVQRALADRTKGKSGHLTTEEREELARLRKEVRELRMERDLLKKAAAFFAKEGA